MGLMVIFALTAILALYGAFTALRNKNFLGVGFALATVAVFGWFTVMTLLHHGFPAAH
ncbi:DUF2759 domain-containing protein [Priestia abyssalis]|uniref:DUF2759 domain-containing protein n=1 Tax=Priestia abyssalis TaxID=1221450 RepID=UPI000995D421|nr:DUF2759 domain-containing protein [Priestia abyssalis]